MTDQEKEISLLRKQLNIAVQGLEHYSSWKSWARPYTHDGVLGIKKSLYRMGNDDGYARARDTLEKIKELKEDESPI